MPIILWNTERLAIAIAENRVSADEKFRYLLLGNCMFIASAYIGSLFMAPPSGWIYWYEAFLAVVVTYFGLLRCRDRYEGAKEDRLLESCIILGFPLGLKLTVFTWIAHVVTGLSMRWVVSHLTLTNESPRAFAFVGFILNAIGNFHSFLIVVVGLALYYWRLSVHLSTLASDVMTPRMQPNTDVQQ